MTEIVFASRSTEFPFQTGAGPGRTPSYYVYTKGFHDATPVVSMLYREILYTPILPFIPNPNFVVQVPKRPPFRPGRPLLRGQQHLTTDLPYVVPAIVYATGIYREILYSVQGPQQTITPSYGSPFWPGSMGRRKKLSILRDVYPNTTITGDSMLHMTMIL